MNQEQQRGRSPNGDGTHDSLEHRLRGELHAWLDPQEPPSPRAYGPRLGRRIRGPGTLGAVGVAIVVAALLAGPRLAAVLNAPAPSGSPVTSALTAAGGASPTSPVPSGPSAGSTPCPSATQPGAACGATSPASGEPAPNASPSTTAGAAQGTPAAGTAGAGVATPAPRTPAPRTPAPRTPAPSPAPTPTRAPAAPPSPTATPSTGQPATITLADDGSTLHLGVGDTFLLDLGLTYDWSVSIADQSIVSRVPNILVIRGAQGVYQARAAGTTTLTATGNPACLSASPPCALPSRLFRLQIVVR